MNQIAKQLGTTALALVAISLSTLTCYTQKNITDSGASNCSVSKNNSHGWKRFYLEGPDGDAICVYLPRQPKRFPGGKLRGGENITLTADIYLVAENEETNAIAFVYDLPVNTGQLTDAQKAEILFGMWQAIIANVRPALQRRLGAADLKYSDQTKVNVGGREGRVQLFTIGPYLGQARMLFVGKKAYMLMGLWPQTEAEKRSAAFFDSFEIRVQP